MGFETVRILSDFRDGAILADCRSEAECSHIKRQECKSWLRGILHNTAPFWKAESKYDTQYVIYSSWGKRADVVNSFSLKGSPTGFRSEFWRKPERFSCLIACILQAVYDCQLIFLFIFVIESFLIILLNIYRSSDTIVSILTTVCCADGRPGRKWQAV